MNTHEGFIVVGVDHGHAAVGALEFALDEAMAHGCAVEVVTAWLWSSPYEGMDHATSIAECRLAAAAAQDAALGDALEGRLERPAISQVVVHEDAGRALVERAEGARMLVVGSARKGAMKRAVLGSVSEYCLRHAPAPVVVVADAEVLRHRGVSEIEASVGDVHPSPPPRVPS
jgi:nucleotide-binding universal stress UspA family protein